MRFVICDDIEHCRMEVRTMVGRWAENKGVAATCACLESTAELIEYFASGQSADAVLLDIAFGEKEADGISAASYIRKAGSDIPIIFITANVHAAVDGYLVEAHGYVTKPLDADRLFTFLDRLHNRQAEQRIFKIDTGSSLAYIKSNDIVYLEAENHTVVFHTREDILRTRATLSEAREMLGGDEFVQTHRSYIIAKNKVIDVKTTYPYMVTLAVGMERTQLPVGRNYYPGLLLCYSNNVMERIK